MKKHYRKLVCILLSFLIIVCTFTLNSAKTEPWSAYQKFIPNETPVAKRHLRGAWISTVVNLDWPSVDTRKIADTSERIRKSKEELVEILDSAVDMNLNAVFFQVSPEGDAFYKSDIVPWSRYLTGTFGKDPGFDPLEFAVEEAHKRNLEIHAWFNPYRVSMNTNDSTVSSLMIEKSVYKEHPEWIKTAMSRFVVDPGIPEARQWVINRVMEVVKKYDVDGVHFDDYFYYEQYEGEMKDQDTYNKYNKGQFSNIGDFRRNNTYLLVKELSQKIRATKPWVKFGISPSGIWGNKSDGHSDGSNTNSSFTNYDKCFADTKKWVEEELIDYIAPQIYFTFANSRAPYGELASWWANVCKGKNVHLYIGQAFYKINDDTDSYFTGQNAVPELTRQLKFNVVKPEIMGTVLFRFMNFKDSGKQQAVKAIKDDLWSQKALIPVMPWKDSSAPGAPVLGKLEILSNGVEVSWTDNDPDTAYYAIYRFNLGESMDIISDSSAYKLIATLRKNSDGVQKFVDYGVSDADGVYYVVTALDRLHNESEGLAISTNQSQYFPDVGMKYSWAVDAIDMLYNKGVVKGDESGMFNPGVNTKRADFTIMIVKALNLEADFEDNFGDVKEDAYYYEAVGIAKALGIVKGDGSIFNPNANITREDMMVIVVNALKVAEAKIDKADEKFLENYADANAINGYARQAVAILTKEGIVNGFDGKIHPKSLATRAEIAVVISKLLTNIEYL
ncbi:MAG TPA: family 10 glycosylhydrolase [Acetivibrio sp.]|uniref:family 10 glycosylhydrolase n=1 Tax=Acetivibrio sp. TaxID=1872092 RepID=UPI002BF7B3AB|nr:family 10 glycosylhydrolase [Acetivibrio sp.]HOM03048.1 family 10 glycosylhydrolase [Acetivibrio sp.]